MKKITTLILAVFLLLACDKSDIEYPALADETGGETTADGLKWYDVVIPGETISDSNDPNDTLITETYIETFDNAMLDGRSFLPYIEFDDNNNYVGAKRGEIIDGQQATISRFTHSVRKGYTIKVEKGSGISDQQWLNISSDGKPLVWVGTNTEYEKDDFFDFRFSNIAGHETISIGSELAILSVYDNEACEGEPLEIFKLVL